MNEEIIRKLLDSTSYPDILLAMEYIAKNYNRNWFDKKILKRTTKNGLLALELMCESPEDYVFVFEGGYYIWDTHQMWYSGEDDKVILEEDIVINL